MKPIRFEFYLNNGKCLKFDEFDKTKEECFAQAQNHKLDKDIHLYLKDDYVRIKKNSVSLIRVYEVDDE